MEVCPGKLEFPFNLNTCRLEENLRLATTEDTLIYRRTTKVITSIFVNVTFEAKMLGLETRTIMD